MAAKPPRCGDERGPVRVLIRLENGELVGRNFAFMERDFGYRDPLRMVEGKITMSVEQARALIIDLWCYLPAEDRPMPGYTRTPQAHP